MKKIKFFGGLFAMAAVALATTFTSCEKEEFDIIDDPTQAQLTFSVSVIDMATNSDVTAQATVTGADDVTAAKGATIAAGSYTITANVGAATGSVTVNAPAVEPGQKVNVAAIVFLSTGSVDMEIVGEVIPNEAGAYGEWGNQGEFTHSHNGTDYIKNESNYLLPYTASYDVKVDYKMTDSEMVIPTISLQKFIEENKEFSGENLKGEYTLYATAWSYYNAWFTITPGTAKYTFKSVATGDVLGNAVYSVSAAAVTAENKDIAIPGHSHAWGMGHGHGHGHGGAENAGGGVIYAD